MSLNISIINHKVDPISINNAKIIDLDLYKKCFTLSEFKSLFYTGNNFFPNKLDDNNSALFFKNHTIHNKPFNLTLQVIKSYEEDLNIQENCWDPLKKMCLIKDLICKTSLLDFKICYLKNSLKCDELKKIIDYELSINCQTNFIAVIPIKIISCTKELRDIIFNMRFIISDLYLN